MASNKSRGAGIVGRLRGALQGFRSGQQISPLLNSHVVQTGAQVSSLSERYLSALYDSNWLPAKIVDLPSQRIGNRWRVLDDSEDESSQIVGAIREQEEELDLVSVVSEALTTARLFGSALIVPVTDDNSLETPLNVQALRQGSLRRFMIVNRFRTSWTNLDDDFFSPNFRYPEKWILYRYGTPVTVHHSRVWRLDSKPRPRTEGTLSISNDDIFGQSILAPMLREINADERIADSVQFLVNEASLLIAKIPNLARFALKGKTEGDTVTTIDQLAEKMNAARSVRRMVFTDASTTLERLAVQFAGLPKIMEEYALRASGCADIPSTILWGRSPSGMNATGDSDFRNWDETVTGIRRATLDPLLHWLTPFLLGNAGLRPENRVKWSWPSVLDKDSKIEAETTKAKVEAVLQLYTAGAVTLDEVRMICDGDSVLGALPGKAPESAFDVDLYEQALTELNSGGSDGEGAG